MNERKLNQDVWASVLVFAIGLFSLIVSLNIRVTQDVLTSAGLLPLILSAVLMLLSVILFIKSWKKGGRFAAKRPNQSVQDANVQASKDTEPADGTRAETSSNEPKNTLTLWQRIKNASWFSVILSMVIVALLVFVGVPYLGFYISGFIFMLLILLFRAKKIKWYFSILITAVSLGVIYIIFSVLFKLPIQ